MFLNETHFERIMESLHRLHERTTAMSIDVSKLAASEARLVGDVDTLLTLASTTSASLATVSQQLAAAIAANDPAALAAAQTAIDVVVVALDTESAKVEATQVPPVGATGTTGATGA
jgi:flavoprotein